jgi:hypothetical protein
MKKENLIGTYFDKKKLNLERVLEDYQNYILGIIRNAGVANSEVEEIISDVLLIVGKNSNKLNKNLIFSPYITIITRRVILKMNYQIEQDISVEKYEQIVVARFNVDEIIEEKNINTWIVENLKSLRRNRISSICEVVLLWRKSKQNC